jgi:hypothetical protein
MKTKKRNQNDPAFLIINYPLSIINYLSPASASAAATKSTTAKSATESAAAKTAAR